MSWRSLPIENNFILHVKLVTCITDGQHQRLRLTTQKTAAKERDESGTCITDGQHQRLRSTTQKTAAKERDESGTCITDGQHQRLSSTTQKTAAKERDESAGTRIPERVKTTGTPTVGVPESLPEVRAVPTTKKTVAKERDQLETGGNGDQLQGAMTGKKRASTEPV